MLLWKVLLVAAGIGGAQWAVVSIVDDAAVHVVVFGLPALLVALVLSRGVPSRLGGPVSGLRGRKVVAA
ncbi:hypothetical protein ACFQV2_00500 [Actinokineospora soli]|uniref:Uncharacterized protein n=1 Tax=Actinokineospora soli TaxID=1048753 RepID=A0ABW2TH26_9PSEU